MTSEDSRAQYLEQGPSGEENPRLDLVRRLLVEPATWAEPPPEVADGVMAALAEEAGPPVTARKARPARWPLVAAFGGGLIAIAALVFSIVAVVGEDTGTVVAMSGTELEADAWGEAAVRATGSGWWIGLEVGGLPPAPEGSYYEGWVWSDDGEGVSIGTFNLRGGDDMVVLWSGVALADYPEIWVTLEDEAEGPEASERVVMTGRIPEADEA